MSMISNHQASLSQQQQLFHPEARAALSPAGALQPPAEDADDDRPALIPCSTANVGIKLHRCAQAACRPDVWLLFKASAKEAATRRLPVLHMFSHASFMQTADTVQESAVRPMVPCSLAWRTP